MNLAPAVAQPHIVPRSDHPISRAAISANALRVLYRLKDAGYQAFLVGGSVRDLLLGLRPKDFDIATNALPEEVKALFRNCRLIGRRFRLAHVYFGPEIIEVATFRAAHEWQPEERDEDEWRAADDAERLLDARGRILRDNVYGTIEEDVWRRDFTANALYYNIEDFSVWDFVGGVEDVGARRLRLIGDPVTRYHEDPVRMLRAVRFAAKLGFTLDAATERPVRELAYLLTHVPPARLFEEILKLFLSGFGTASLRLLREYDLLGPLFAATAAELERDAGGAAERLLLKGLADTDARVAANKPVTPTFLFAILFYGPVTARAVRGCKRTASRRDMRCSMPARMWCAHSKHAWRFRADSPCRCARCSCCSRAFGAARARRRSRFSVIRAFVPPTISCCCARRLERRMPSSRNGGRRCRSRLPSNARRWSSKPRISRRAVARAARAGDVAVGVGLRRPPERAVRWTPAYVALGSNLADPCAQVELAFAGLGSMRDTRLVSRSRLYGSRPMGPQDQPEFVNAAAGLLTRLAASELLKELKTIETSMGRVPPAVRWGARLIDLDLLLYGQVVSRGPELVLPHPGIHERNFVLYPLADIAPTLLVPGHASVAELARQRGGEGLRVLAPVANPG